MNKNKFLIDLNDFQNKVVDTLLSYDKVIIKSDKFTGKTMICKKMFERINDYVVIYHTGCAPELFDKAYESFKRIIDKYKDKETIILLDEFYNEELLNSISTKDNIKCYVFTNDNLLKIDNFKDFNYYYFYNKFVINEIDKSSNIHEVLNDDSEFSVKNEHLRRTSKETITYIKDNKNISEERIGI